MTQAEIAQRLRRVYAALGDVSQLRPEDFEAAVSGSGPSLRISVDFTGGRSQDLLDGDAAKVINEIMGIRDRAKAWLKSKRDNSRRIDNFIESELAVALVHDLANTDKHGRLDHRPFSGHKPKLRNVSRAMTLRYDPSIGTYARNGEFVAAPRDIQTGERTGNGSSSMMEVVLIGQITDEAGAEVGELQKVLPDAVFKWEQFLRSLGLPL